MEYYWLMLNRSFVVLTYPEGLYGWKFSGLVSTRTPLFFVPFEECTTQADKSPETEEFQLLMKESGSVSIPRSEIASVDYVATAEVGDGECPPFRKTLRPSELGKITRADTAREPKRRGSARRSAKWNTHRPSQPYCINPPFGSSPGGMTTAAATRSPGSICSRRTPCALRPDSRIVPESMRMILPYWLISMSSDFSVT
jgi:hypothetical protein